MFQEQKEGSSGRIDPIRR